jgi:NADPH:quinone reductase-like Zn-dependent oxidoreductase
MQSPTVHARQGHEAPLPPSMRAIRQAAYGSDPLHVLELADVPTPHPQPGQVLVKVSAASVDLGTWHLMSGRPLLMRLMGFGLRRPKAANPGRAFAGTVVTADDDSAFRPGDTVYGTCDGSFSEYVIANPEMLAIKPNTLTFEEAAAVPVSAVAALQAVRDKGVVREGQRALVIGAAGGVGAFIVQLVRAYGGDVTGVASTPKLELVRSLGAEEVIDYTRDDFAAGGRTYDVVFDTGGNRPLAEVLRAVAPGGTLVIVGGESDGRWLGGFARILRAMALAPTIRRKRLRTLASKESAEHLEVLRDLFDRCELAVAIDRSYPLGETAEAVRHLQDGHAQGKVVISLVPHHLTQP